MADAGPLARLVHDMPVVSSHTHHWPDGAHASLDLNRVLQGSYVGWLGHRLAREEVDPPDLLDQIDANTYFVWLSKAIDRLYGLGEITPENWDAISEAIHNAHQDPMHHVRVMTERCRMKYDVLDALGDYGSDNGRPDLFHPAYRINRWCMSHRPGAGDHSGRSLWDDETFAPTTFDEYLDALDARIVLAKARGAVASKTALAYDRTVSFDNPDRAAAERAFRAEGEVPYSDVLAFGDVVFHRICEIAEREHLPIQVHLGLARLRTSRPMLFEPTIARYGGVTFDLFHCGYPWVDDIGGLLHNYGNVYADLCWLPLISTYTAERALNEYLDVVRSSDRILWGDDTWTSEEAYGAVLAWEHVVSCTLARRLEDGLCSARQADRLAEKLMYANAERLFGQG